MSEQTANELLAAAPMSETSTKSLAERIAEKVCGNAALPGRRWLGRYDETLAAINEALEAAAQEAETVTNPFVGECTILTAKFIAARVRALKGKQ